MSVRNSRRLLCGLIKGNLFSGDFHLWAGAGLAVLSSALLSIGMLQPASAQTIPDVFEAINEGGYYADPYEACI